MSPRAARRGYRNPMRAGVLTVLVLVFVTVYGFTKDNPFSRPFHIGAVVENAAGVKPGSIVRIAGVDVGQVSSIERYNGAQAAKINMDINANGLPVHEGATVRIRPRLFLEGNFVLDVSPGAPGSADLKDGDTIPLTQTSRSVQLDEVLSTLQGPERADLQTVIKQLGTALASKDPSDQNPLTKGESAGQSLQDTIKAAGGAGQDIEKLARALQGQDRGDLAAAIESFAKLSQPLADNADELAGLIDGLDRTVSVFADNSTAVRASISQLPGTVQTAQRTLPVIQKSLAPIGAVSRNVTNGLDRVPALVKASGPFLDETKAFLSDDEAGALVTSLEPISAGLAKSAPALADILSDLDRLSVCTTQVLAPTANQVINDGQYTTGLSVWDETLRSFVGLASAGQNYDANGAYGRATAAQGNVFVSGKRTRSPTESTNYVGVSNGTLTSTRPAKPAGTKMSSTSAPWKWDVPCNSKQYQSLSSVPSGGPDGSAAGK